MTIHYATALFSLLLLWFPRQWLRAGGRIKPKKKLVNVVKEERDRDDRSLAIGNEITNGRNWVDFFRALAGCIGIMLFSFDRDPEDHTHGFHLDQQLRIAILIVAVLVQMIRFEKRLTLFAPIFFIQGLSFGILSWPVALFAMIGSWALNPILPTASIFLFVYSGVAFCLGVLLKTGMYPSVLIAFLAAMPVVVSALMKRRLAGRMEKKLKIVRERT